jgi:hypothetical protein
MSGDARVLKANRSQLCWDLVDLEAVLPMDHRARLVWRFVATLEPGPFYEAIKSRAGEAGRPAADPKVLPAPWLYATLEGVGSARELDRWSGGTSRIAGWRGACRSTATGVRTSGLGKLRSWTGG